MENNIKKMRKEQGLSIRQLSKLTGISVPTLSRYETEKRKPKIENWQKLADYFGVNVEYLQGKTFINKRTDKEETTMNDLIKVNFQFMNSDVNTTTYIKKIDYLELINKNNKRFIEYYEEDGNSHGAVNLDQIVHISLLEDYRRG